MRAASAQASAAPLSSTAKADFSASQVTVQGRALPPQVSERDMSGQEARTMPGAVGDVVRAVSALPGAVTPNDYLSNLLVRGSGFNDNLIEIDGIPAAYPFHFGGLESVFHPGLVHDLIFLPGAFDSRFGDTLGGVLDLHTKDVDPGLHGEFGASLIQLSGLLSYGLGPANDPNLWQLVGAVRRGDLDLVLPPSSTSTFQEKPRWDDYHFQLRGPLFGGQLRAMVFGSQDSLVVVGGPESYADDSDESSSFNTVGLTWTRRTDGWLLQGSTWGSADDTNLNLGPGEAIDEAPYSFGAQAEAGVTVADEHSLDFGAEYQETRTYLAGEFARVPAELGTDISFSALTNTAIDAWGSKGVLGTWAQDRWQIMPSAAMTLGARYDHVDLTGEFHFSPRWTLEILPWDGATFRASVGDYFESPTPMETVAGWNSIPIGSTFVRSYTAGIKQKWDGFELGLEAYHKDFESDVPATAAPSGNATIGNVEFNAVDTGWAEGTEMLLRAPHWGIFSGWFSGAWSDDISSPDGIGFAPTDFSQPLVGDLVVNAALPWGFTLGGRFRAASGIPYTPVASRTYNSSTGVWTPTFGATNSQRLPDYERLDLRLEKRWSAEASWWRSVDAYVDVINVTGADNVTSVTYTSDYSGIELIPQFPRLPFVGADFAF